MFTRYDPVVTHTPPPPPRPVRGYANIWAGVAAFVAGLTVTLSLVTETMPLDAAIALSVALYAAVGAHVLISTKRAWLRTAHDARDARQLAAVARESGRPDIGDLCDQLADVATHRARPLTSHAGDQ